MASRRNLRDMLLILILAALCFVVRTPTEEPVPEAEARVTIDGYALGEPLPVNSELSQESVPFGQARFCFSRDRRFLARVARPTEGITELEGVHLEQGGRHVAGPGTSREMVVHHLGRPFTSRRQASKGVVEDYYPAHDLLVRYRGYQLEKVWMQADSAAWFKQGNWPEPLSDYF